MLTIEESKSNATEWQKIDRMVAALRRPPKERVTDVQEAIRQAFLENFEEESAGGQPWRDLAFATVIDRIILGFPGEHPILRRTGHYQSSWVDEINGDHISEIEYTNDGIVLREGSKDERAQWLEPDRPVAVLNNGQTERVAEPFITFINQIINGR